MLNKKVFLILFLLVIAIGTISSVSADDSADGMLGNATNEEIGIDDGDLSEEVVEIEDEGADEVLNDPDGGTFTALQNKINNAQSEEDAVIELENDYYYHDSDGYLVPMITKTVNNTHLTINGNGKVIDGSSSSTLLRILGGVTVNLNNITFQNGNDTDVIFVENADEVVFRDCTFIGNEGYFSGAIMATGNDKISFVNCKFTGNSGEFSGAVYVTGADCLSFLNCSVILNIGEDAAALRVENVDNIYIHDSNFTSNLGNYGGGVYVSDSNYSSIEYCNFRSNLGYCGAALDMADVVEASIVGCEFFNNFAIKDGEFHTGGAAHIQNSSVSIDNCNFTDNHGSYGAAVYMIWYKGVSFTNCDFSSNVASATGGAIYFEVGDEALVSNCNFYNNSAYYAGGVFVTNSTNFKVESSDFTDQEAYFGSAICLFYYDGASIEDCSFISNGLIKLDGVNTGGAIYVENGKKFQLKKSDFQDNMALNAGALFLANAYDSVIDSCDFTSNYALNGGGAINFDSNVVKLVLASSNFTANYAFWGGALYLITADDFKINSCYFKNNQAVTNSDTAGVGGATYANQCYGIEFNSCDFVSNYAKKFGGAIAFVYSDNCNFNNCNFIECFAPNCGAAVVMEGEYTFNKCKFLDNFVNESIGALLGGVAIDCIFEGNSYPQYYETQIINTNTQQSGSSNNNPSSAGAAPSGAPSGAPGSASSQSSSVKAGNTKVTPKIVASKKTFKLKAKTKKYTITLKGNSGKLIKNAKVSMKVKGKNYIAKTNAKGKATFKLKLNKKGNYKATVKYAGNGQYNAVSKNVKITVK
jgi:hypothetical protein